MVPGLQASNLLLHYSSIPPLKPGQVFDFHGDSCGLHELVHGMLPGGNRLSHHFTDLDSEDIAAEDKILYEQTYPGIFDKEWDWENLDDIQLDVLCTYAAKLLRSDNWRQQFDNPPERPNYKALFSFK